MKGGEKMKLSYNVPFPSGVKNMGEELTAFYEFFDSDNQSVCFEFDTEHEAKRCSCNISSARWRRDLPVEIKKIGNKVYVKKVK